MDKVYIKEFVHINTVEQIDNIIDRLKNNPKSFIEYIQYEEYLNKYIETQKHNTLTIKIVIDNIKYISNAVIEKITNLKSELARVNKKRVDDIYFDIDIIIGNIGYIEQITKRNYSKGININKFLEVLEEIYIIAIQVLNKALYEEKDIKKVDINNINIKDIDEINNVIKENINHYFSDKYILKYSDAYKEQNLSGNILKKQKMFNNNTEKLLNLIYHIYSEVRKNIMYEKVSKDNLLKYLPEFKDVYYLSSHLEGILQNIGVCITMSQSIELLSNIFNLESAIVIGRIKDLNNMGHAWNLFKIEENYYIFDTTEIIQKLQFTKRDANNKIIDEDWDIYELDSQNIEGTSYYTMLGIGSINSNFKNIFEYIKYCSNIKGNTKKNIMEKDNNLNANTYISRYNWYFKLNKCKVLNKQDISILQSILDKVIKNQERLKIIKEKLKIISYTEYIEKLKDALEDAVKDRDNINNVNRYIVTINDEEINRYILSNNEINTIKKQQDNNVLIYILKLDMSKFPKDKLIISMLKKCIDIDKVYLQKTEENTMIQLISQYIK
ncbi:MAG: hypothetical protein ACTTGJ_00385 [Clostridium sp.]